MMSSAHLDASLKYSTSEQLGTDYFEPGYQVQKSVSEYNRPPGVIALAFNAAGVVALFFEM